MGRRLPPFTAVRAFEAAARLHSFKAASAELCVTQSAVSHQIAALEQFLDVALFLRSGGKVELTPSGSRYYADLTLILDRLDQSTQETRAAKSCRPLSICSTPMFALRWLLPRLKRFSSTYPEIELEVTTTDCPMHFPAYGVDVLVQYGTARAKGLDVEPFLISARHPVCSPRFLDRNPQILTLSGLAQSTLLHDVIGDDWAAWFQSAGLEAPVRLGGPRFSHCELSVRAAE